MIHVLATQPATARFISYKLARRFVADEPPASLVDRAAATFRKTDGDIREVLRTIVTSPEFSAPEYRQAKVKTPFEFVVSAVRASGAEVRDAGAMAQRLAQMGMPLYQQQPPTGYSDTADAWVSTSGLLARLNFALDLPRGRLRGSTWPRATLRPTSSCPRVSDTTRRTLASKRAWMRRAGVRGCALDLLQLAGIVLHDVPSLLPKL
jgi:uncharacterized protein (DUF1800 family)